MRKSQWIDIIKDATKTKFSDRTIAIHIEMAQNTVLGQIFRADPAQVDFFAKPYPAAVVHGDRPYALLPKRIIQNVDFANGVRRIYPVGDNSLTFVPMPAFGHALFSEVGLDQVDDSCGYEVKTDRVMFWNLRYPVENVIMELVIPFSDWDDEDDFPIPIGTADQITQLAISTFKGQQAETNIYKKPKS
jgi:hypothetical protein